MAKGINIPFNIQGLRQAKEDLAELGKEIDKVQDVKQSQKLVKQYNDLSKAIDTTTDELIELNKAGKLVGTRFDDLNEVLYDTNQEVLPLSSQIGEMEDRLYQLAKAGDTSSDEFKALSKEIVDSRKVIRQVDKDIDLLAENQGLSVFATGWSQVGDSILSLNFEQAAKDAESLSSSVGNLGKIGASSIKSLGQTVGTLGKTFLQFGKALLLNPIFLLVGVITAIVVGIGWLLDKLGFLEPIFTAIGDAIQGVIDLFKDFLDFIGLTNFAEQEAAEEARKKKVAESKKYMEQREHERRVVKAAIEDEIAGLDRTIALYQAQGKSVVEVTKQKINAQIQLLQLQDQEAAKFKDYAAKAKDFLFETKQFTDELSKTRQDTKNEILNLENELKIVDIEAGKAAEERAKERAATALDIARQLEDLRLQQLSEGYEKERQLTEVEFRRQREDVLANEEYTQEQKNALVEELKRVENKMLLDLDNERIQKQRELNEEAAKFREQAERDALLRIEEAQEEAFQNQLTDQERELEAVQYKYDELINLATIYGQSTIELEAERNRQLNEINSKYAKEEEERNRNLQETKTDLVLSGFKLAADAANLFADKSDKAARVAFNINKAQAIAQATVDGYRAALSAYAQTPGGPVLKGIAAGIAGGFAAVQIAGIAKTKYEGGNSVSSSAPSTSNFAGGGDVSAVSATPSFNLFGQSNALDEAQGATSVETNQNIVVQAVVSETEVTGTQDKIKNIQKNAEL